VPRPQVSVVVPFRGDERAARRLAENLEALEIGAGDELIVADNSEHGAARHVLHPRGGSQTHDVVLATAERSSYHARNAGALRAAGEWLLFIDSDCIPVSDLIDAYFTPEPGRDVGALAGTVATDPAQTAFLARYARDRHFLDQDRGLHTGGDAAATANLMVRRAAFQDLGGFAEGIRSGGDVDLCRRLIEAGWTIERRPHAVVRHVHRESLPDLLGSVARYAAGARWLNERYPGTAPRWPLVHGLVLCARDIACDLARLRLERAAFRGVDALGMFAHVIGYSRSNAAS
jgi:cellulose synthase/poly-beta-1,6-N-acetylglucosamine synthase-like glycosyltransferase